LERAWKDARARARVKFTGGSADCVAPFAQRSRESERNSAIGESRKAARVHYRVRRSSISKGHRSSFRTHAQLTFFIIFHHVSYKQSAVIVRASLKRFRKERSRFTRNVNIEEYR